MLHKSLSLADCQIKLDADRGTFVGYASVFGGTDSYGDTILRGAYDSTLRNHGKPKMFFNHDAMSLPLGKWTVAREDDHGLWVEGELTAGNRQADDVRAALKHGTLDGLSIGYLLKKGDFDETDDGRRIIKRITRLAEVSVVTFPADEAARVDLASVKAADLDAIETIRDFERHLRDACGLSKAAAAALAAKAKAIFTQRDAGADADELQAALARLQALSTRLP
jgi:uncharacterized protein